MAMTPWGDPNSTAFRKRQVREVRIAGSISTFNKAIATPAARLLEELTHFTELPEHLSSYDPEGLEHQRLGLAFRLPLPASAEVLEVLTRWGFKGFNPGDGGYPEFRFVGTVEDAERFTDEALARHVNRFELPDVGGPSPFKWPGHRDLVVGDSGSDVYFLQAFLGLPTSNTVDEQLLQAVLFWKQNRGHPNPTPVIDRDFWTRLIPRRLPMVSQGDATYWVRLLQAGILAQDLGKAPVTGIWGSLTAIDVRELQKINGFPQRTFVRDPEWALVLGPRDLDHYAPLSERDTVADIS
jgi:hypothetical protein